MSWVLLVAGLLCLLLVTPLRLRGVVRVAHLAARGWLQLCVGPLRLKLPFAARIGRGLRWQARLGRRYYSGPLFPRRTKAPTKKRLPPVYSWLVRERVSGGLYIGWGDAAHTGLLCGIANATLAPFGLFVKPNYEGWSFSADTQFSVATMPLHILRAMITTSIRRTQ